MGEFAVAVEAGEDGLEDLEGGLGEFVGGAVTVDALVEVGLGEGVDFSAGEDVDEVGDFDAVAGGEGEGFEEAAAGGVFASEGLVEGG